MRCRQVAAGTGFEEHTRQWLKRKEAGELGELRPSTMADYRSCVEHYLLPALAEHAVEEIGDVPEVQGLASQRRPGATRRDRRGR